MKVLVWGHVGIRTGKPNSLLARLEQWQLRNADMVLAYTESGRREAVWRGADTDAVVSLNNTVDISSLATAVRDLESSGRAIKKSGKALAYIGGLDASKRIAFLVEALDHLWSLDKEVTVLIAGAGSDADLLKPCVERGQVTMLGRVGDRGKAEIASAAELILMPGRVGLIAAESFVLGTPIVTVAHDFHAPEFEYLELGRDSIATADDPEVYAREVLRLLNSRVELEALQSGARAKSGWPSLDHMIEVFTAACLRMVERDPSRASNAE